MEESFFTSAALKSFPYQHKRHKIPRRPSAVSKRVGFTYKVQ